MVTFSDLELPYKKTIVNGAETINVLSMLTYTDYTSYKFFVTQKGDRSQLECRGIDIKNDKMFLPDGKTSMGPYYEQWKQYVIDKINENNQQILNGDFTGRVLKYIISDIDEDGCCTYEFYVDKILAQAGKGWLKDIKTDRQKELWRDAVKEYKKSHNEKTRSEQRKEKTEKINEKAKKLDSTLLEPMPELPPLLTEAIKKYQDDPCNFITEVIQKGIQGVTGLSMKEIMNYYTKLAKHNITVETLNAVNAQSEMIEYTIGPVTTQLESFEEYFAQLDTDREEWLKQHSNEICLLKAIEYEEKNGIIPNNSNDESYTGTNDAKSSRKVGTLEWNTKPANEEVITERGKLWSIINKDLGLTPTKEEADKSMTKIDIKIKDANGVLTTQKITVHKASAGTVKKMFEEIATQTNCKMKVKVLGYTYRTIANSTTLSRHSFGVAFDVNYWDAGNPDNSRKDVIAKTRDGNKIKDGKGNYVSGRNEILYRDDSDNTDIEMRSFNHPVVKIFRKYGFGWGGAYSDYMHFSALTYTKKINDVDCLGGK